MILRAGALLCVLFASNADARPKHGHQYRSVAIFSDYHRYHFVDVAEMVGCQSCDFFGFGCARHQATRTEKHANLSTSCSDAVMRSCGGSLNFQLSFRHHPKSLKSRRNSRGSGHFVITHRVAGAGKVIGELEVYA